MGDSFSAVIVLYDLKTNMKECNICCDATFELFLFKITMCVVQHAQVYIYLYIRQCAVSVLPNMNHDSKGSDFGKVNKLRTVTHVSLAISSVPEHLLSTLAGRVVQNLPTSFNITYGAIHDV